ncbi:MAG: amino acid ABC transporter permease [Eubacteriales bacterium]|nr:amino acid ABC transporter permease [Eubacteriales bacterium]
MWRGHELFAESLPVLVEYIPITLIYFMIPTVVALILGALICAVRVGKKNILYYLVSLFVSFFRGTPGLVQIYLVFFGLPKLFEPFGININRWDAGIFYLIATCCNFSSFVSEAMRGAYEAIDKNQIEAGYSIGYSRWQCFWHVTAPLTMQIALPNLKNLEIDLLKGTAVAYVIGVVDVMGRADKIIAQHRGYGQIWILLAAAVIYFLINVAIEVIFNWLTAFFSRHERGIA